MLLPLSPAPFLLLVHGHFHCMPTWHDAFSRVLAPSGPCSAEHTEMCRSRYRVGLYKGQVGRGTSTSNANDVKPAQQLPTHCYACIRQWAHSPYIVACFLPRNGPNLLSQRKHPFASLMHAPMKELDTDPTCETMFP